MRKPAIGPFLLGFAAALGRAAFGQYTCSTIGGGGPPEGSVATAIAIRSNSTAVDSAGNLYTAFANRVYKVATNGTITTVAGNGTYGYSGDNGLATSAQISDPDGVAVDSTGNLYIGDTLNGRVRIVSNGGTITTFAGGGTQGLGDGGLATNASLSSPAGLAVDAAHNVYIEDKGHGLLRKVSGGVISSITTIDALGSYPFPGDGGVAVDSGGDIYLGDPVNARVLRLVPGVNVTNVTSSIANASYGVGALIPIQVAFTVSVTVTGTPQLALNSGGTANYVSGSGTSTLTFNYTVAGGQNS